MVLPTSDAWRLMRRPASLARRANRLPVVVRASPAVAATSPAAAAVAMATLAPVLMRRPLRRDDVWGDSLRPRAPLDIATVRRERRPVVDVIIMPAAVVEPLPRPALVERDERRDVLPRDLVDFLALLTMSHLSRLFGSPTRTVIRLKSPGRAQSPGAGYVNASIQVEIRRTVRRLQ